MKIYATEEETKERKIRGKNFLLLISFLLSLLILANGIPSNYGASNQFEISLSPQQFADGEYDYRIYTMDNKSILVIAYDNTLILCDGNQAITVNFPGKITLPDKTMAPIYDYNNDGKDELLLYALNQNFGSLYLIDDNGNIVSQSEFPFATESLSTWSTFEHNGEKYIVPHINNIYTNYRQLVVLDSNLNTVWSKDKNNLDNAINFDVEYYKEIDGLEKKSDFVIDFNNDGTPDLILAEGNTLYCFNALTGEVISSITLDAGIDKVIYSDIDEDNKWEIITKNSYVEYVYVGFNTIPVYHRFYSVIEDNFTVKFKTEESIDLHITKLEEDNQKVFVASKNTTDGFTITTYDINGNKIAEKEIQADAPYTSEIVDLYTNGKTEILIVAGNKLNLVKNSNLSYVWSTNVQYSYKFYLNVQNGKIYFTGLSHDENHSLYFAIIDGANGNILGSHQESFDITPSYPELSFFKMLDENNDGSPEIFSIGIGSKLLFTYSYANSQLSLLGTISSLPSIFHEQTVDTEMKNIFIVSDNNQNYSYQILKGYELANYDLNGTLISESKFYTASDKIKHSLTDYAITSDKKIYIVKTYDNKLLVLDSSGNYISKFNINTKLIGNFSTYTSDIQNFFKILSYQDENGNFVLPDFNNDSIEDFAILSYPISKEKMVLTIFKSNISNPKDISAPFGKIYFGAYYVPITSAIMGAEYDDESIPHKIYIKEYNYEGNEIQDFGWLDYNTRYTLPLSDYEGAHIFLAWVSDRKGNISSAANPAILNLCHENYSLSANETIPYIVYANVGEKIEIKVEISSGDVDLYGWKLFSSTTKLYSSENSGTQTESIIIEPSNDDEAGYYYFEVNAYYDSTYTCTITKLNDSTHTTPVAKSFKAKKFDPELEKIILDNSNINMFNTYTNNWYLFK